MPAPVICSVCGACECILRRERCLQPTFCRACGACGEEADACNPHFIVPAVPATRAGMPATYILPSQWCLRRRQGCLQPTFCCACDEDRDACSTHRHACNPRFAVSAVPATKRRMPATHVLPCLRCLRRRGGCLQRMLYRACRPETKRKIPAI